MDILLGKVTQQAMNYAIRSGITITAGYAIRQSSRLLKTVEQSSDREELQTLQERLQSKISIISPAIDMIELISARGNTSLESAVNLTQSLRWEIQSLGQRLAAAANEEDLLRKRNPTARSKALNEIELKGIVKQIKMLLSRIEDAVPLINLAITTSGASLSTNLPTTISPSRLLQASTFVTAGDSQYSISPTKPIQIGPTFTLSLYMLFSGHLRPQSEEDVRQSTWKEVIHKARLKMVRVPLNSLYDPPKDMLQHGVSTSPEDAYFTPSDIENHFTSSVRGEGRADEYAYRIVLIEDLDDDRVHTFEDDEPQPSTYDGVELAGIREAIPIHEISKIFYADTGKILNIGSAGEPNSPVLLLKRDVNAIPPRKMMDRSEEDHMQSYEIYAEEHQDTSSEQNVNNHQSLSNRQLEREHRSSSILPSIPATAVIPSRQWRIPANLDPEWLAFEVYTEASDSDNDTDANTTPDRPSRPSRNPSVDPKTISALANVRIAETSSPEGERPQHLHVYQSPSGHGSVLPGPTIRTSLSLLETILRLLSLQQFQQTSHLAIPDELLNFFLSESATTGAANGDDQERRRLRNEARSRVGFDPYDESPVKRRGEEYQYRGGESQAGWHENEDGQEGEYAGSARQDSYNGYSSPRWDEGYETRRIYSPSQPGAPHVQEGYPETPLLIRDRSYQSRSNTSDRAMTPLLGSPGYEDGGQPLNGYSAKEMANDMSAAREARVAKAKTRAAKAKKMSAVAAKARAARFGSAGEKVAKPKSTPAKATAEK
ncbi:hypothetical protein MMC13_006496 [Lambiella insularis]|nr:hypothetical protein [Lambiella insularis]